MLEEKLALNSHEWEPSAADMIEERRCSRLAKERGVPYEDVLRETRIKRQAFWANYTGNGTIADMFRWARSQRRRNELEHSNLAPVKDEEH